MLDTVDSNRQWCLVAKLLFHADKMPDLFDHPENLRGGLVLNGLVHFAQAQRLNGILLGMWAVNDAFNLGDFYLRHLYRLLTDRQLDV